MKQPDKSKKKTHTIKTKSGSKASVTSKSVKDAKAKKGAFKERPAYKGKEMKSGTVSHSGKFTRTTNPTSRRAARKVLEKEKRVYQRDSTAHSQTIKRFAKAKRNKN